MSKETRLLTAVTSRFGSSKEGRGGASQSLIGVPRPGNRSVSINFDARR
jgi:hypothetical protein